MFKNLSRNDKKNFFLLLGAAVFHFCSMSFMFLLPKYVKTIGGNENQIGMIIGMFLLPALIVPPLAGYIVDRHPGKKLMMLGTFLMVLGTFGFLWVKEISFWIYVLRFFQGMGHLLFFSVLFSVLSHIIPSQNRAQGVSYLAVMFQVANSTGTLLAEKIIIHAGFTHYFLTAFFIGLVSIFVISFLKEHEIIRKHEPAEQVLKESYGQIIFKRKYLGGFLMLILVGGITGTTIQFMATFLEDLYKNRIIETAILPSYFLFTLFIVLGVTRLFFSKIPDKIGHKKAILYNIPLLLGSLLLPLFVQGIPHILFMAASFGLSIGFLYPSVNSLIQNRVEACHRGKITGILVMLYDAGFSGFAFFMGPVAFLYGYSSFFILLAGIMFVGTLIFIGLERKITPLSKQKLNEEQK